MVCCLLCFGDGPIDGDPRAMYGNNWQTGMMEAPCKDPMCFCLGMLPCIMPCVQYKLREKALNGDISNYKCCQGYYDNRCFKAGKYGDTGSAFCMCIEACCCTECMVSSSRMLVMDSLDIMPDPCDNRIIRFNNCLQLLSCVCWIASMIEPSFRDLAAILDLIADIVFMLTVGCMTAQTNHELNFNKRQQNFMRQAPRDWYKKGGGQMPSQGGAPQQMQMSRGGMGNPQVMPQPMQQQMMVPQAQVMVPQQQRQVMVTAPPGTFPGQPIQVQNPYTGQMMSVQIPNGVQGGQQFAVNM